MTPSTAVLISTAIFVAQICMMVYLLLLIIRWRRLNLLLAHIAGQSFAMHAHPMFKAWCQTMGSISVEVSAIPKSEEHKS